MALVSWLVGFVTGLLFGRRRPVRADVIRCHHPKKTLTHFPASGELITCSLCPRLKFRAPGEYIDWKFIQATMSDGRIIRHFVCNRHFPPDRASEQEFAKAFAEAFRRLGLIMVSETQVAYRTLEP